MRWFTAIALTSLVAASCGKGRRADDLDKSRPGEPAPQHGGDAAAPSPSAELSLFAIDATEGLPAELATLTPLWESARHPTQRKAESVARLYPDGRLYRFGDTRRTSVDGMPGREPAPKAWRLEAKISADAIKQIEALIRNGFVALAANPPAAAAGTHGRLYTWRAHVDGEHVVVTPALAMDALPAPIREIERAVQTGVVPGAVPIEQP